MTDQHKELEVGFSRQTYAFRKMGAGHGETSFGHYTWQIPRYTWVERRAFFDRWPINGVH